MAIDDGLTVDEKRDLLKSLKEALYTGATRVRFGERDVRYRSLEEMRQIIGLLEDELAGASGGKRAARVILATFRRG